MNKKLTQLEELKLAAKEEFDRIKYDMPFEAWADLDADYPGYAISSEGRVFSYKTKALINPQPNYGGYLRAHLHLDGKDCFPFVHRLVAAYFCPNPQHKNIANHINNDKLCNTARNLEWVTQKENCNHYIRNFKDHKFLYQYNNDDLVETYDYIVDAIDTLGVTYSGIRRAVKNGTTYAGYTWKYE